LNLISTSLRDPSFLSRFARSVVGITFRTILADDAGRALMAEVIDAALRAAAADWNPPPRGRRHEAAATKKPPVSRGLRVAFGVSRSAHSAIRIPNS